jgi:hypothetical protein
VPGEDIGTIKDAGMVQLLHLDLRDGQGGTAGAGIWQETPGIPGVSETGDRFGASVAALDITVQKSQIAIGVPGEDIGTVKDAGDVTVATGDLLSEFCTFSCIGWTYILLTQGATGRLGGAREANDHVGATVADQGPAQRTPANRNLVIGVPGEDLGQIVDAGVALVYKPTTRSTNSYGYSSGATAGLDYGQRLTTQITL